MTYQDVSGRVRHPRAHLQAPSGHLTQPRCPSGSRDSYPVYYSAGGAERKMRNVRGRGEFISGVQNGREPLGILFPAIETEVAGAGNIFERTQTEAAQTLK